MTCIVGYMAKNKVYIGGDSIGANVRTYRYSIMQSSKVFINGEFIFGFTSSFRMGQLLKFNFNLDTKDVKKNEEYKFMCISFVDALRAMFNAHGFSRIQNNEEQGGEFLVGFRGQLYHVYPDYTVSITENNYDACGCGEACALGAMFVLDKIKNKTPQAKITEALQASVENNAFVKAPYVILSM